MKDDGVKVGLGVTVTVTVPRVGTETGVGVSVHGRVAAAVGLVVEVTDGVGVGERTNFGETIAVLTQDWMTAIVEAERKKMTKQDLFLGSIPYPSTLQTGKG